MIEPASWMSARTKYQVERYFTYLVAAIALVGLLGVGLVYAEATPPEDETETERLASMSLDSTYGHSATVDRPSLVFNEGDRLENRPLYFLRVAPTLAGEYTVSMSGVEEATVQTNLSILHQHVETVNDEDVVHWEEIEMIETAERILADGEAESISFSVDVRTLQNRSQLIADDLDAEPGETRITVVAETSVDGETEAGTLSEQRTDLLEISPDGAIYRVENTETGRDTVEITTDRTVPGERSTTRLVVGLLMVVGAIGGGYVTYQLHGQRPLLDLAERERVIHDAHREKFEDWISRGSVPEETSRTVVEMDSLKALVDVAVDANTRVVDRGTGETPRYVVLTAGERYVYDPTIGLGNTEMVRDEGTGSEDEIESEDGIESEDQTADQPSVTE